MKDTHQNKKETSRAKLGNRFSKKYTSLESLFPDDGGVSKIKSNYPQTRIASPIKIDQKNQASSLEKIKKADRTEFNFSCSIGKFVEEVAANPRLISELIDYRELAEYSKAQIQTQKQRIQKLKSQYKEEKDQLQQLLGSSMGGKLSKISSLKNEQIEINKQIQEVRQLKHTSHSKRQAIQQQLEQRRQKIKKEFNQRKSLQNQTLVDLNKTIAAHKAENNKLQAKIKQAEKKVKEQGKKSESLMSYQNKNKVLKNIVEEKRRELAETKKKQTEALQKYRGLMADKMGTENKLKRESEQKLNKFLEEVKKVLEQNSEEEFNRIMKKYNGHMISSDLKSIRSKNSSTNTKPQEGEQLEKDSEGKVSEKSPSKEEKQLLSMQKQNPTLKSNKNIKVTTLDKYSAQVKENISSDSRACELYTKSIEDCDQKIKKLIDQQNERDLFISSMQAKLDQIEEEIKIGTVLKIGLKKATSTRI